MRRRRTDPVEVIANFLILAALGWLTYRVISEPSVDELLRSHRDVTIRAWPGGSTDE
jgi:hypothetical protein